MSTATQALPASDQSAPAATFAVTVVVPTFRRPATLIGCLNALTNQSLPPTQVVVVVRSEDIETRAALAERDDERVELATVELPGQTHALNTALKQATGDVVAFTDDDAEPRRDWLERLCVHYADPMVGAVGGKVIVPKQTDSGSRNDLIVGEVSAIGRPLGNHHLGDGPARPVMWLKGVNMSYRRQLCRFDESLRGSGAQVANDSEIALRAYAAGWRVIYEPNAAVDHYAGPRFDEDGRDSKTIRANRDAVFNETLVLMRWLPRAKRIRAVAYLLLVGVPRGPGPVGAVKAVLARRLTITDAVRSTRHASASRIEAIRAARRDQPESAPSPPNG